MDDWWMYEWMNGWNEWMNKWMNEWMNEWMNVCMNEWMDDPMDYFNLYVTSWSPLQERLDITQPRRLSTSFIQTSKRPMIAVGRSSFFYLFFLAARPFLIAVNLVPRLDCCLEKSCWKMEGKGSSEWRRSVVSLNKSIRTMSVERDSGHIWTL